MRASSVTGWLVLVVTMAAACGGGRAPVDRPGVRGGSPDAGEVGQTSFTTLEGLQRPALAIGNAGPATALVEEADIHRIVGTRLFHLNTYRGFLIYELADPRAPVVVARLPIHGYPVEMFVEGNTVHALMREALSLTQVEGKLQFQRRSVSQLVTIDISDATRPRVLATLDIAGYLREGASRKVGSHIFVVSRQWGADRWPAPGTPRQAVWAYSFDVSDPGKPRQVAQLPVFERDDPSLVPGPPNPLGSFSDVVITATASKLLVAESYSGLYGDGPHDCARACPFNTVVSVFDLSDPAGAIRRQSRFELPGEIRDQFEMAVDTNPATGKTTFFGILAVPARDSMLLQRREQHRLESWDVSDGAPPRRLSALDVGTPGDLVTGSSFDLQRQVVHTSGLGPGDPLVAISLADPAAVRLRGRVVGAQGPLAILRPIHGGEFLLGIGLQQDCDAPDRPGDPAGDPPMTSTRLTVSVHDVRDPDRPALVQRKCVDLRGTGTTAAGVSGNLERAHKMVSTWTDGDLNLVTVPVWYAEKRDLAVGWWYQWQTGVNLMSWDLTRHDPARAPADQLVLQSHGNVRHAEGEVTRSVPFRHPLTGERLMVNLSNTHLSVANLQDLANPRIEAVVEVAPAVYEVARFGEHVVERVDLGFGRWSPQGMAEFRVKTAGGSLGDKPALASFQVGQAASAHQFKNHLVVLRRKVAPGERVSESELEMEAVIYDLSDPPRPRQVSRLTVPFDFVHYGYHCGTTDRWGHWFGSGTRTIVTDAGLVQFRYGQLRADGSVRAEAGLVLLDLRNPAAPKVIEKAAPFAATGPRSLVADSASPLGFYLTHREAVEDKVMLAPNLVVSRARYFAQRWDVVGQDLIAGVDLNLPGVLTRTWQHADGERLFLTHDVVFREVTASPDARWLPDSRVHLLRQRGAQAELRQTLTLDGYRPTSLVSDAEGGRLFLTAESPNWGDWWVSKRPPSDRLLILEVGNERLSPLYDQSLGTYGAKIMGVRGPDLFLDLLGDGVLVLEVSDPARPRASRFVRTLGYTTHIDFAGDEAYVAAGHYGVFNFGLRTPAGAAGL